MVTSPQNIRREKRGRKTNKQFYDSRKMEEMQVFYGILENEGKRVSSHDAFSYACECVENGTEEEKQEFMKIASKSSNFEEFADTLVEWFFSGSWVMSY